MESGSRCSAGVRVSGGNGVGDGAAVVLSYVVDREGRALLVSDGAAAASGSLGMVWDMGWTVRAAKVGAAEVIWVPGAGGGGREESKTGVERVSGVGEAEGVAGGVPFLRSTA